LARIRTGGRMPLFRDPTSGGGGGRLVGTPITRL